MILRLIRLTLAAMVILVLGAGLFAGGYLWGVRTAGQLPRLAEPVGAPFPIGLLGEDQADAGAPPALQQTFAPFWEVWNLVHAEYVDQPLDDVQLMRGALRGMLKALDDEHTAYMSPEEYAIMVSDFSGELQGIGAEVDPSGDYLKVISPLHGSPAEAAGIRPGDLIVKVNGEDMKGRDGLEVIARVRGPAGTTVRLSILREGEAELLEFEIVRAKIVIPSVESQMLAGNIAYVKINQFGDKTTADLGRTLKEVMAQEPAGMVLDLRGNPGGHLDAAIAVASQFITEGAVMVERFGDGREETYSAQGNGLATEIPLVVLVDEGSASASEIVAGAIQDYGRGALVGEQTYGKGTVQDWRALRDDQGAVRITIARWLTPQGRSVDGIGLTPDAPIERTEADRAAGRDPQLDEALRVLQQGLPAPQALFRAQVLARSDGMMAPLQEGSFTAAGGLETAERGVRGDKSLKVPLAMKNSALHLPWRPKAVLRRAVPGSACSAVSFFSGLNDDMV